MKLLTKRIMAMVLSVVLVLSAIYVGTSTPKVNAADGNATAENITYAEKNVLADNDYDTAKSFNVSDAQRYQRGNSHIGEDPDNSTNQVIINKGWYDHGIVYLGDAYTTEAPVDFIKAEPGMIYQISYKWKYVGTQTARTEVSAVLAKKPDDSTEHKDLVSTNAKELFTTISAGTYSQTEWNNVTETFTIDSDWDMSTYKYLALYSQNFGDNGYLYIDDVKVTAAQLITTGECLTSNDYSNAKLIPITDQYLTPDTCRAFTGHRDPLDETNIVLGYKKGYWETGALYLGGEYRSESAYYTYENAIKAEAGKSYLVEYDYYASGQVDEKLDIYLTAGTTVSAGEGEYKIRYDADNAVLLKSYGAGTSASDTIWSRQENKIITLPANFDAATYPYLMIYAQGGGGAAVDVRVGAYFDNVKVTEIVSVTPVLSDDSVLARNDYSDAGGAGEYGQDVTADTCRAITPYADPLDSTNKVLGHVQSWYATGALYLGGTYYNYTPHYTYENAIKAEAGKSYLVEYDYYATGTANDPLKIYLTAGTTVSAGEGEYKIRYDADNAVLLKSYAQGENATDSGWGSRKEIITLPTNFDAQNYPYLMIYTNGGGTGDDRIYAYFDNVKVTEIVGSNFIYCYDDTEKLLYSPSGMPENYQPSEEYTVEWYMDETYTELVDFENYERSTTITTVKLYGKRVFAKGDLNNDGKLDANDAVSMRKYLVGIITDVDEDAYDMNDDNAINVKDLVALKKLIAYPNGIDITSVTLSLYEKENDTYTYGVAWQTDEQLTAPVVEVIPATEDSWDNAIRITGTSEDSTPYETFVIKDAYGYTAEEGKETVSGEWYYSNITDTHDVATIYSNKLVISGLSAGVEYKYRVGMASMDAYSDVGTFTAASNQGESFDFIFMTDSQQIFAEKTAWNKTLKAATENMPNAEFIAHGGDLINWNSIERQWTELLHNNKEYVMNMPIMPTAGNHELNMTWSGTGVEYYDFNNHFNLPYSQQYDSLSTSADQYLANGSCGTYYSYDYKNVHFVVLNSNEIYISNRAGKGYVLSDGQMAWLRADLESANANDNIDYTIVYMHHGLYTTGAAGLGNDKHETQELRKQLQGVLAEHGVDLVMNGHDHVYSVTKVLDKDGAVVTDGSGVVYMTGAIAGSNGPGTSLFETNSEGVETNTSDKYDMIIAQKSFCWTELSVTSEGITVTTYTAENGSATELDSFTVKQNNVGTTF